MPALSALPPGPTTSPYRQAARFGPDPYNFLVECARTYGDIFTFRLPNETMVVLTAPDDIKWFFTLKPEDYAAARASVPVNLGDDSLLFLDGDLHKRERQLLMPPLHGERLLAHTRSMHALTDAAIDQLKVGETVRAHAVFQDIALGVILECVFGVHGAEARKELGEALLGWLEGAFSPQVFAAGTLLKPDRVRRFLEAQVVQRRALRRPGAPPRRAFLPWRRLADQKLRVEELLLAEIERVRASGTAGRTDALSLLLEARYDDGAAMTDAHIITELITLLVGGHETTSSTLAWTVEHLFRQPELLARAHAELDTVFAAGFDPRRCGELPFLEACIKEAMRLTPIAVAVGRNLSREVEVRGYRIPAGTTLWAGVAAAHRRPETWPEPDLYRPDRFLQAKPAPGDYLPFGGGRRLCIGMAFAQHEMRIVLARFLHRVRGTITTPPARPVFRGITLAPIGGVPLTVTEVRAG